MELYQREQRWLAAVGSPILSEINYQFNQKEKWL